MNSLKAICLQRLDISGLPEGFRGCLVLENLPKKEIRSIHVSPFFKNWDVISEMENLVHLSLVESVLRHARDAKYVFTFAYPKLRFLSVHRDFGYKYSCLAIFSEMIKSIGPWIQGLKISHTFVCTKKKVGPSLTCGERFSGRLLPGFTPLFDMLGLWINKSPIGFFPEY